ncbi:MAG: hypothetical protein J5835_05055 [Bacteroidales bacterium]|nr:hypothetical protein [Bacteroidales bacterium]
MKTKFFLSVTIAVAGLLAGISAFAQTTVTGVNVTKFEATSVEAQPKMLITPIAADITIIQSNSSSFKTQGVITIPEVPDTKDLAKLERYAADAKQVIMDGIEELKAKALFEFAESAGADLIVAPLFSVVTDKSDGRNIYLTVKVKGYPAKYTNFRNVKPADTTIVYINRALSSGKNVRSISTTEAVQAETKLEVK